MSIHNSCKYETYYRGKYNTHATYNSNVSVASQNFQTNCANNQNSFLPYLLSGMNLLTNLLSTVDFGSSSGTSDASSSVLEVQTTTAEVSEAGEAQPVEDETEFNEEDILEKVFSQIECSEQEKGALDSALRIKYSNIIQYASSNNIELTEENLITRLTNYAKGMQYNRQFNNAYNVGLGAYNLFKQPQYIEEHDAILETLMNSDNVETIIDYTAPENATDEEKFEALKGHYQNLADAYVEYFDTDCNGSVNLMEMFVIELAKQYLEKGQTPQAARANARQEFANMDIEKIVTKITNREALTMEETLYLSLYEKFNTLNINEYDETQLTEEQVDDITNLSRQEVQRFWALATQYDNSQNPDLTDMEYFALESDIIANPDFVKQALRECGTFFGLQQ